MKSETFTGTFFEVKRQLHDWKIANPQARMVREGAPVASGEQTLMLDAAVWALTIEYEEPNSS